MNQQKPYQEILRLVRRMTVIYEGETDDKFKELLYRAYESHLDEIDKSPQEVTVSMYRSYSVAAVGVLCFGVLDAVDMVLNSIAPPPADHHGKRALIYRLGHNALRLLFPLPDEFDIVKDITLVKQWFNANKNKLIWSEDKGKYYLRIENEIRIRASVILIEDDKILLVPEFYDDAPTKWVLPGGGVEFGERLRVAAEREMLEETGLIVECQERLDVFEVLEPSIPYHSIAVIFKARFIKGELKAEEHRSGRKEPRWFTVDELQAVRYHPQSVIDKFFRLKL